jgi:hypothetical protein
VSVMNVSLKFSGGKEIKLSRGVERQLELPEMPSPERKPKKKKNTDPILAALARVPWVAAPEVASLADELIPLYHTERWYQTPQILYFFCEKAPKAGGFDKTATVKKVGGMTAWLLAHQAATHLQLSPNQYNLERWTDEFEMDDAEYDLPRDRHVVKADPVFIISVHYGKWIFLEPRQRRALVDHELRHICVEAGDKDPQFYLDPHSVEEFTEIIERYGPYDSSRARFGEALERGKEAESNKGTRA